MHRTRPLVVLFGVLAVGIASAAITGATLRADTAITCTNPSSGMSWQIKVDYDHRTVDSNPAAINDAEISWHDANDGGNYKLDRKSGKLTVIVASSTGGYFLYDHCGLQN
jgi:hypothetical protein